MKVAGCDAMDVPAAWAAMTAAVRNLGRPGIAAMAISAVDNALWDLKARLLGVSLLALLGAVRERIPVYGSGGFTSYSKEQLQAQLSGWAANGIRMAKMKIGRDPEDDLQRVRWVRHASGPKVQLLVDANGAYSRKQALAFADAFQAVDVSWFEEPVPSDDLEGLRLLRDWRPPAEMDIAAGEYGYESVYFRRMLDAEAVDVLQADATVPLRHHRVGQAAALRQAHLLPLSAHCVLELDAHLCCAVGPARHLEYFHDHAWIQACCSTAP